MGHKKFRIIAFYHQRVACFSPICGGGGEVRVWGSSAEDVTGRRYRGLFVFLKLPLHSFNTISLLRFVTAVVTGLLFCIFLRFVLLFSNSIWTLPDSGGEKEEFPICLVVDALCFGLKSCKFYFYKNTP